MVEEVIEGRYTPVRSILEEQLTNWYGVGNFKILVSVAAASAQNKITAQANVATTRRLRKVEG